MKHTRFAYGEFVIEAGRPLDRDIEGEFFTVDFLAGTAYIALTKDGEKIPIRVGMEIRFARGEKMNRVFLTSAAGATVKAFYGFGSISLGGSGSGSSGTDMVYTGDYDDPNGNVVPDNLTKAAIYYKDESDPVVVWSWSVSNQNWFAVIIP